MKSSTLLLALATFTSPSLAFPPPTGANTTLASHHGFHFPLSPHHHKTDWSDKPVVRAEQKKHKKPKNIHCKKFSKFKAHDAYSMAKCFAPRNNRHHKITHNFYNSSAGTTLEQDIKDFDAYCKSIGNKEDFGRCCKPDHWWNPQTWVPAWHCYTPSDKRYRREDTEK